MSKKDFINAYLNSSKLRLELCNSAFDKKAYDYVVRECQTVIELSSKALLIRWGQVVPEKHNLSKEISDLKELFSEDFQKNLYFIKIISTKLRSEREVSLYGDVDENISPDKLYTKEAAESFLKDTNFFYNLTYNELKFFLEEKKK